MKRSTSSIFPDTDMRASRKQLATPVPHRRKAEEDHGGEDETHALVRVRLPRHLRQEVLRDQDPGDLDGEDKDDDLPSCEGPAP